MTDEPGCQVELELQRHAAALRGLAGDLLRDPHAADDVTQATLQQAIQQRDLRPGPLGGWLRTVLQNFARQWRRSERRRAVREAAQRAPEPAPSPIDALARRETVRALTDAVLQLDEPYRTVVMLRYFEDLPPRAIAQRTACSVATVKSRLQRALLLLRTRLARGRARDDWRLALAGTFGWPVGLAAPATSVSGLTAKVLLAGCVLGAGGLLFHGMRRDPPPPSTQVGLHAETVQAPVRSRDRGRDSVAALREEPPPAPPAPEWLDHPFCFELELRVVDRLGLPLEGRKLRLAPQAGPLQETTEATGPDGTLTVSWRSRRATGSIVVGDEQGLLRRIALRHGTKAAVTLGVVGDAAPASAGIPVLVQLPGIGHMFRPQSSVPDSGRGLHPYAVFAEPVAHTEPPITFTPTFSIEPFVTRTISLPLGSFEVAAYDVVHVGELPAHEAIAVTGVVTNEDGGTAEGLPVALLGSGPQPLQRTTTDQQGRFTFADLEAGTFTVRAGGTARGLAVAEARAGSGPTRIELHLRRSACVRGRVQGPDGTALAQARIVWCATDGSWWDTTVAGDDGSFVLANLPPVRGDVSAFVPGDGPRLPFASASAVLADSGELLLRHRAASALQLEPVLPLGREHEPIEVRVWQLDTGLGVLVPPPSEGAIWCLRELPVGWYEVEIGAPGSGWISAGQHWLDGRSECQLGRVLLPAPGEVRFVPPPDPAFAERPCELCRLRPDFDVRMDLAASPFEGPVPLPAGEYALLCAEPDGGCSPTRFAVRPGETTIVPLADPPR